MLLLLIIFSSQLLSAVSGKFSFSFLLNCVLKFLHVFLSNTGNSNDQYCLPANDYGEYTSCATSATDLHEPISTEEKRAENNIWENSILTLITKFTGIISCVLNKLNFELIKFFIDASSCRTFKLFHINQQFNSNLS